MAEFRVTQRPSFKDIAKNFVNATKGLPRSEERELHRVGRKWVRLMREEAPKKTGEFADGIDYELSRQGPRFVLRGIMPQPLGKFITEGTKPHRIAARRSNALRFFWPKIGKWVVVPKSANFRTHVQDDTLWVGKGYVDHPGTAPNPFNVRVFRKIRPDIQQAGRTVALDWIGEATSS